MEPKDLNTNINENQALLLSSLSSEITFEKNYCLELSGQNPEISAIRTAKGAAKFLYSGSIGKNGLGPD